MPAHVVMESDSMGLFSYEALHTTGRQYIVDDISMYIEVWQPSME